MAARVTLAPAWQGVRGLLEKKFETAEDVVSSVRRAYGAAPGASMMGLTRAMPLVFEDEGSLVRTMESVRVSVTDPANDDLLPVLRALSAIDATSSSEVVETKEEYTAFEIRKLLELSFWGLLPRVSDRYGLLHWSHITQTGDPVGPARIACFLDYLRQGHADGAQPLLTSRTIRFRRLAAPPSLPASALHTTPHSISPSQVAAALDVSATKRLEDFSDSTAVVDFANRRLHIHKIIPSATQEEVMFSVRHELMLAVGLYETLLDSEAAYIEGAQVFAGYTGYADSFRYKPLESVPPLREAAEDIVAIDANMGGQFKRAVIDRDVVKAYLGFLPTATSVKRAEQQRVGAKSVAPVIATGKWGCGVFGGDVVFKFVQQLMAAAAAGVHLQFSAFHDEAVQHKLRRVADAVTQTNPTWTDLYSILTTFGSEHTPSAFENHLHSRLMQLKTHAGDATPTEPELP